ncbi:MAG: hypothetical protein ACHRHE_01605 [Tepidisphaerales bacterium]
MSSVSMSGVGQSLFQYLRSLSANGSSQTTQAGKADSDGDADGSGGAKSVSGGHHHHHGNSAAFQAIQQAVTDALNSASTTPGSTTTSDPNKLIEDALAKVLAGQGTASTTPAASTPPSATPGSAQINSDATSRQAFFQLLQDHGIDPQQFRQDFLAAIKDAQGGQVNSSTAFQSFPAGTSVDTTA